jgi:hypothetical protein
VEPKGPEQLQTTPTLIGDPAAAADPDATALLLLPALLVPPPVLELPDEHALAMSAVAKTATSASALRHEIVLDITGVTSSFGGTAASCSAPWS